MSKYEWEEGTLVVPTAEFAKLRRAVCEDHNAWMEHCFTVAQNIHTQVSESLKGKRLPNVREAVDAALEKHMKSEQPVRDSWGFAHPRLQPSVRIGEEGEDKILQVLLNHEGQVPGRGPKLKRPLKKDFPTIPLSHNEHGDGDVSLHFNSATHSVRWSVSENNRAVEKAWESQLGQAFAKALSKVTWTRSSGGSFLYNNEYNRDSDHDHEGDGGSTVSRRFGPLGNDLTMERERPSRRAPSKRRP